MIVEDLSKDEAEEILKFLEEAAEEVIFAPDFFIQALRLQFEDLAEKCDWLIEAKERWGEVIKTKDFCPFK